MSLQVSVLTSILTLMLLPVAVLAQDAINLRQSVTVSQGEIESGSLPLDRIASIQGNIPHKLRMLQIPIDMQGGEVATLALSTVRTTIETLSTSRGGDVNLGRIAIAGSTCTVRLIREEGSLASKSSDAPASADHADHARLPANAVADHGTLRAAIESKIASMASVTAENLKLSFEERDEEVLQLSTTGRSVVIQPVGGGERVPFQVRLYESGELLQQATIRVGVLVLREVVVAKDQINRGSLLSLAELEVQQQWLPLSATAVAPGQAVGMVLRNRIKAGDLISRKDLEASIAVNKGDLVTLISVIGGVELRTTGRALASAKEGDVILFETMQWKSKVSAKVSGHGSAMVVAAVQADSPTKTGQLASTKK